MNETFFNMPVFPMIPISFIKEKKKSLYTAITVLKVWNQHSPFKACFEQRNIDFTHGRV